MTAMAWGDRWCAAGGDVPTAVVHAGCGRRTTAELRCSHCHRALQARDVRFERRPAAQDRRLASPQRHRAPGLDLLERRRPSSIARTLQVMGDRWSGLVIRECFFGVRRFDDFQHRLAIATNILAQRLERLTDHGVLERVPYQRQPLRHEYRLTGKGLDLYPVPLAMLTWGDRWLAGGRPPVPLTHRLCGHHFTAVLTCNHCGDPLTRPDVSVTS
jgi:DNA-binding HxlR family transcriptional regulator